MQGRTLEYERQVRPWAKDEENSKGNERISHEEGCVERQKETGATSKGGKTDRSKFS